MITPGFETTQMSSIDNVRIAALGAGLQGEYGAVINIARKFGVSRPTVYAKAEKGRTALASAFEPQEPGTVHATVEVDEATLQRAIVSCYVGGPNSVRDTQASEEAYKHACEHEWPHYGASQKFRRARELFEAVVNRHDAFEKLMNEAIDAMEFADLATGALRTGREQAARIKAVARYLKNRAPGLALYIDELNAKLAGLSPRLSPELVRACCKFWRLGKEHCRAGSWKQRRIVRTAKSTVEAIVAMAPHKANDVFDEVHALIARRHRASSAVENFNTLLRPYLHVPWVSTLAHACSIWVRFRVRPEFQPQS